MCALRVPHSELAALEPKTAQLHSRIAALVHSAEQRSRTKAMTTHEAKDFFRARRQRLQAHRLTVLLRRLAHASA